MPLTSAREGNTKPKRKSLFTLTSLSQIQPVAKVEETSTETQNPHRLVKRRVTSAPEDVQQPVETIQDDAAEILQASPRKLVRPARSGLPRPTSVFGSLRSLRSADDEAASPVLEKQATNDTFLAPQKSMVLRHGEVQTSGSMFRKKKEYLVLTETHIVRCKSQNKAAETFHTIPNGKGLAVRHSSSQSIGSLHEAQSFGSDSSGDRDGRIPLRQIVAVYTHDESKPYYTVEVCHLDEDSNLATAMVLHFNHADERDTWTLAIRTAAHKLKVFESATVNHQNAKYVARIVEREGDYDPTQFQLYKVIQRSVSKTGSRASTDDLSKIASVIYFLAVGLHKVHLIPLPKTPGRVSSPALNQSAHGSYGILTINTIRVSHTDDSLELTFRQPLKRPKLIHLASVSSHDIALSLHSRERFLRPECAHWLYKFLVPPEVEQMVTEQTPSTEDDHCALDRTLTAYCIAYDVNPSKIRYTINYECEDAPRFDLLPIADTRRQNYHPLELLAVMRALRYNESFGSLSFAGICLDSLHSLTDEHGADYVCVRTKRGVPLKLSPSDLARATILVQEIRALASTSSKLRRLDFSDTVRIKPPETLDDGEYRSKDTGCGIAEALFPLCQQQTTNVDWIIMSGITFSELDLDYLVGAAVDRKCHFRALQLSRCGLNDRTLGMILDALRAHDNTLEALDISGNFARLSPIVFDSQISVFGFIRSLDLSHLARTSGSEPLLEADTLLAWRLETLKLSGTSINEKTVEALAVYLSSTKSNTLRELILDNAYLSGQDVARLMEAMTAASDMPRELHLDISHNNIYKGHEKLCSAFIAGHSPTQVTLRAMEYRDEVVLRHLFNAIRQNRSTRYLDISRSSLPGDASEDTTTALGRLFAENDTLEELDISGEDSRLETSKFGNGLNTALLGLKSNTMLKVLRVEFQKLSLVGASVLTEVLKENSTLREIHCGNNEIPLSAFTDLVNALVKNTSLLYLPMMDESRAMALHQTEKQVKQIRDGGAPVVPVQTSPSTKSSSFGMRRGLASAKRNLTRGAAAPPSFPSLGSPPSSTSDLHASTKSPSAPLPQLSDQDVLAALRLVAESWDRQQYRLQQYLQRNWCIVQGMDVPLTIQDEDFERPASVATLASVLEKVKIDSTPTVERAGLDFPVSLDHVKHISIGSNADLEYIPASPRLDLSIDLESFMTSPESVMQGDDEEDAQRSLSESDGLQMHGLGLGKTPTKLDFGHT